MKDEKTEIPEVIFDKPDLEKARVSFYGRVDTLIENVTVERDKLIDQLQASLAYAAGQLSGLEQNKDKHPEEIFKELLDYRG